MGSHSFSAIGGIHHIWSIHGLYSTRPRFCVAFSFSTKHALGDITTKSLHLPRLFRNESVKIRTQFCDLCLYFTHIILWCPNFGIIFLQAFLRRLTSALRNARGILLACGDSFRNTNGMSDFLIILGGRRGHAIIIILLLGRAVLFLHFWCMSFIRVTSFIAGLVNMCITLGELSSFVFCGRFFPFSVAFSVILRGCSASRTFSCIFRTLGSF